MEINGFVKIVIS